MLSFLKSNDQDKDRLHQGALEKQPLEKCVRPRRRNLRAQLCHFTDGETGSVRGNDLAKETKLVSGKTRVAPNIPSPNLLLILLCQCYVLCLLTTSVQMSAWGNTL